MLDVRMVPLVILLLWSASVNAQHCLDPEVSTTKRIVTFKCSRGNTVAAKNIRCELIRSLNASATSRITLVTSQHVTHGTTFDPGVGGYACHASINLASQVFKYDYMMLMKDQVDFSSFLVAGCPAGRFGHFCNSTCHCVTNSICSKEDGGCSLGCANSWSGQGCQIEQKFVHICADNLMTAPPRLECSRNNTVIMVVQADPGAEPNICALSDPKICHKQNYTADIGQSCDECPACTSHITLRIVANCIEGATYFQIIYDCVPKNMLQDYKANRHTTPTTTTTTSQSSNPRSPQPSTSTNPHTTSSSSVTDDFRIMDKTTQAGECPRHHFTDKFKALEVTVIWGFITIAVIIFAYIKEGFKQYVTGMADQFKKAPETTTETTTYETETTTLGTETTTDGTETTADGTQTTKAGTEKTADGKTLPPKTTFLDIMKMAKQLRNKSKSGISTTTSTASSTTTGDTTQTTTADITQTTTADTTQTTTADATSTSATTDASTTTEAATSKAGSTSIY